MTKSIELKQIGYLIEGEVSILLWGNDTGVIGFTPFQILKTDLELCDVIMAIDDGGFGCQKLLSAEVEISELYEGGYTEHYDSWCIVEDELDDYNFINSKFVQETYNERYPNKLNFIKYMK